MSTVNWQVTATTIYCNAVDDEVTIMIYQDWSAKCTGYDKYNKRSKETAGVLKKKSRQLQRKLECNGLECTPVLQYKERLLAEETGKR